MQRQEEAGHALKRFLADDRAFARILCTNYDQRVRAQHGQGRTHRASGGLCLAPDGIGGWAMASSDIHPLALPLPLLSREQYLALNPYRDDSPGSSILHPLKEQLVGAWSRVAFLADDPTTPFWCPGNA